MSFTTTAAHRSMHAGRHLRSRPARPATAAPVKAIKNGKVSGNELFDAIVFLGDALGLPRLHDADRTSECINLNALRASAAATW